MPEPRPVVVGVDVGGTKTCAAVVDAGGAILARAQEASRAGEGPAAVLDVVAGLVRRVVRMGAEGWNDDGDDGDGRNDRTAYAPLAIGIGTAGIIHPVSGTVVSATEVFPGWAGTDVRREVADRLRADLGRAVPGGAGVVTVAVDNDVNAHALGECWLGASRGLRHVLHLAVGTGVGGALIIEGRLAHGMHGAAGEVGHLPVPAAAGRRCSCGTPGHLEAVAAGPAVLATYELATGRRTDIADLAGRAALGEANALAAVRAGGTALGEAIGGLVNVLDPQIVVVTGGVTRLGPPWWTAVQHGCEGQLVPAVRGIPLATGDLGEDAGIVGAARLAWLTLTGPEPSNDTISDAAPRQKASDR